MSNVSIRDLRNNGGAVIDRATRGETIIVTKSGRPVAELRRIERPGLSAEALVRHWRALPRIDADRLRTDIDSIVDPSL